MITKITYVATDGKEFTTEQECLNYENAINDLFVGFTFFNADRNMINKNQSVRDILSEAKYFYVSPNLNAEKLIFSLERINKYDFLFDGFRQMPTKFLFGLWFNDDDDKWISYNVLKTYYDDLEKELRIKIADT